MCDIKTENTLTVIITQYVKKLMSLSNIKSSILINGLFFALFVHKLLCEFVLKKERLTEISFICYIAEKQTGNSVTCTEDN